MTTESFIKMVEKAFYFMLKLFFALKKFTFLSLISGYVGNDLIRTLKLISKFITSGQQIIKIHILPTQRAQEV